MKHSPGPTPLWFTTISGKRPSKWKMETDKHNSFEVLYPRGALLWLKSGVQLLRKSGYILPPAHIKMVNLLQIFFSLTNTRHVWGPHPSYYQPSMAITAGSPLPSNRPVRHKRQKHTTEKRFTNIIVNVGEFRTWNREGMNNKEVVTTSSGCKF